MTNPMCFVVLGEMGGSQGGGDPIFYWDIFASVFSGFQHMVFAFGNFVLHGKICGLAHGFLTLIKKLRL
jgi:hypothetical protein